MAEATQEYRDLARKRLLPVSFDARVHFLKLLGLAGAVAVTCAIRLRGVTPAELLCLPAAFLYCNLFEYLAHRFPLHRTVIPRLSFLHRMHQGLHHRCFTYDNMVSGDVRDAYFTFFPVHVYALYLAVMLSLTAVLTAPLTTNCRLLCTIVAALYIVNYELFHALAHETLPVPVLRVFRLLPFLRRVQRHHRLHHHWRFMHRYNFNITYPICDVLFGTYFRGDVAQAAAVPRGPAPDPRVDGPPSAGSTPRPGADGNVTSPKVAVVAPPEPTPGAPAQLHRRQAHGIDRPAPGPEDPPLSS